MLKNDGSVWTFGRNSAGQLGHAAAVGLDSSRVPDPTQVMTDGKMPTNIIPAHSVMELVVAGRGGVPVDASAVVLNVTVTEPQGAGYVTVWPCGVGQPNASSLNYSDGQTVANAVIAKVGAGGKVCVYNFTANHVVVDVNGFEPAGSPYGSLTPSRLLDSRTG